MMLQQLINPQLKRLNNQKTNAEDAARRAEIRLKIVKLAKGEDCLEARQLAYKIKTNTELAASLERKIKRGGF